MKKKKQNLIIDCDVGVDDAIAIMYALQSEDLNIQLLSTEAGNNPIESITQNTLHLTELLNKKVPVVEGVKEPIKRQPSYALNAQGKGGLGGYKYNRKKIKTSPLNESSSDAIYKVLKSNKEKTTIVAIGPMTNIAVLLKEHPDAKDYIKEIVFESGTKEKIYGKPYKSFNVGFDPEAAEIVFKSGIPLVMIPMELGHIAYLNKDDIKQFKKTNKIGKIFAKMFKKYHDYHVGHLGAAVHDACTIFYLLHPEFVKNEQAHIEIKYYKTETDDFGYVDIDFKKKPNATVCIDLVIDMFKYEIFDCLKRLDK